MAAPMLLLLCLAPGAAHALLDVMSYVPRVSAEFTEVDDVVVGNLVFLEAKTRRNLQSTGAAAQSEEPQCSDTCHQKCIVEGFAKHEKTSDYNVTCWPYTQWRGLKNGTIEVEGPKDAAVAYTIVTLISYACWGILGLCCFVWFCFFLMHYLKGGCNCTDCVARTKSSFKQGFASLRSCRYFVLWLMGVSLLTGISAQAASAVLVGMIKNCAYRKTTLDMDCKCTAARAYSLVECTDNSTYQTYALIPAIVFFLSACLLCVLQVPLKKCFGKCLEPEDAPPPAATSSSGGCGCFGRKKGKNTKNVEVNGAN